MNDGVTGEWNRAGRPSMKRLVGAAVAAFALAATVVAVTPRAAAADGDNSMGFIGCSMAENVVQGYHAVGGKRLWNSYGIGGMVVSSWTDSNSRSWQMFDEQVSRHGKPTAVWVQLCTFTGGASYDEIKQVIASAHEHAPDATVYITGQPQYDDGMECTLSRAEDVKQTDALAKQAGADSSQNVTYSGSFHLKHDELSDGCHANSAGQQSLGKQAMAFWQ